MEGLGSWVLPRKRELIQQTINRFGRAGNAREAEIYPAISLMGGGENNESTTGRVPAVTVLLHPICPRTKSVMAHKRIVDPQVAPMGGSEVGVFPG